MLLDLFVLFVIYDEYDGFYVSSDLMMGRTALNVEIFLP